MFTSIEGSHQCFLLPSRLQTFTHLHTLAQFQVAPTCGSIAIWFLLHLPATLCIMRWRRFLPSRAISTRLVPGPCLFGRPPVPLPSRSNVHISGGSFGTHSTLACGYLYSRSNAKGDVFRNVGDVCQADLLKKTMFQCGRRAPARCLSTFCSHDTWGCVFLFYTLLVNASHKYSKGYEHVAAYQQTQATHGKHQLLVDRWPLTFSDRLRAPLNHKVPTKKGSTLLRIQRPFYEHGNISSGGCLLLVLLAPLATTLNTTN